MPRIPAARRWPGYVLKAVGLVAVAVLSGYFWWLGQRQPVQVEAVQQAPAANQFSFAMADGPVVSTNCAAKSSGAVKQWFTQHPCQRLARALFNTAYGNSPVIVSVAVVTTSSPAEAQQLKALADRDGTGNVVDLLRDGTAHIAGAPPNLTDGKYGSAVSGNQVVLVLSEFIDQHTDDTVLQHVDTEALGLAGQVG
jgi:hypothetical protein